MSTTEAADLARTILDLTHEDETVTVCSVPDNKVAALARAVIRMEELADRLDAEAKREGPHGVMFVSHAFATEIRNALEGETA